MKPFARNLRRNQSDAERRMWRHLKNRALSGFKFRRQCPIGPYIVDFVCLEKMIVIEIDGGQHAVHIQKDAQRTKNLAMRGFRVLRFWNNEVLANTESVLNTILTALLSSPSSPSLLPKGEGSMSLYARSSIGCSPVTENVSLSLEGEGRVRAKL
jgi:adenine-specific DNA-methyltransferase